MFHHTIDKEVTFDLRTLQHWRAMEVKRTSPEMQFSTNMHQDGRIDEKAIELVLLHSNTLSLLSLYTYSPRNTFNSCKCTQGKGERIKK